MLRINLDNDNVYVSCDYGEWHAQPLDNTWLWLLSAIQNGDIVIINDDRKELQDHQRNLGGIFAPYEESENPIEKAITYCEELIDKYDDNMEIDDLNICHIIEILKGRE